MAIGQIDKFNIMTDTLNIDVKEAINAPSITTGAAKRDITPPLEVGLLMSSVDGRWMPFEGVRQELFARAVVLRGQSASGAVERVAIVSLDLLALSGEALGGFAEFKSRIADAAGNCVHAHEIVLSCTHTHSAPESGALTDLYRTVDYAGWLHYLILQIGQAIQAAYASGVPCQLSYGTAGAGGLGIHRRFKTTRGVMMSHPEPPADVIVSRDGAVDDSVNVLAFRDRAGALKAVVVNATCHPVYEMCIPQVSPDYPGELAAILEAQHPEAVAVFLNGAAGNVNPQGVSAGPSEARRHAESIGRVVNDILGAATVEPTPYVALSRHELELPTRLPSGDDVGVCLSTEIAALQLGSTAVVFIPGEPFAETALAIRKSSVFELTFIVGFSEETIGYIPIDQAYLEGGYEADFGKWSYLAPGSEPRIQREAISLLEGLAIGVDEISPQLRTVSPSFGVATAERASEDRPASTIKGDAR